MFANLFLSHKNKSKVFIIESTNHAVVYDGKDTWDINLGFVLRNYRYPEKHIPTLEFLQLYRLFFVLRVLIIVYHDSSVFFLDAVPFLRTFKWGIGYPRIL